MESDLPKLNILELESLRGELIDQGFDYPSDHLRIHLFFNYFDKVLAANDTNIVESFLGELIEDYFYLIRRYEVWGIETSFTEKLLRQLNHFGIVSLTGLDKEKLASEIQRIEKQFEKLSDVLRDKSDYDQISQKAFFPLIDNESPIGFYGVIDSLTVRISKSVDSDKFIIIPSEKEIEKRISDQCKNSWLVALNILNKYVKKPFKYHEVIVNFDKKVGFYEGYSLGIALTLTFLEELLKFYNPQYIIKIREQSAFTGGLNEEGYVLDTGEDIIKQKVAAVFYSDINSFVFPKLEETYAYFALTQLKKKYPQRTLKLIPVEDINDVLNRRDLVEIKRVNPVVRAGKLVKKNWISSTAAVLMLMLFSYFFILDFDNNPFSLDSDGRNLVIKNGRGKILWTKPVNVPKHFFKDPSYLKYLAWIIDIDNDGKNELILSKQNDGSGKTNKEYASVSCFDYKGSKIWSYSFTDSVFSLREALPPVYGKYIIDTVTFAGRKSLILVSTNAQTFSSALFRIDLQTGMRLPGTLWCSGFVMDCIIKDVNNDGKKDIIGVGLDNGFEEAVFFVVEIDTLPKVRPSTEEYQIRDHPEAEMIAYIRFPKNDYDNYLRYRMPAVNQNSLIDMPSRKQYQFITGSQKDYSASSLWYQVDYNFKDVNVIIDNRFRVMRDSLVAKGVLSLPYTDTPEYVEKIKSKVLYWKPALLAGRDGQWVTKDEIK